MTTNAQGPSLPPRVDKLWGLANNLWWSWHPQARELFRRLDPALWKHSRHNPIKLLQQMAAARIFEASQNEAFLRLYDEAVDLMARDLARQDVWFPRRFPAFGDRPVAFFSAEFGLHQSLPLYAGGLGILAGDICKEASDSGIPMVGVGFMYPKGYFHQHILPDGRQEEVNEEVVRADIPVEPWACQDQPNCTVRLPMDSRTVCARVWVVNVGFTRLLLLDTEMAENSPEDRQLSAQLYSGDREWRLRQELVLGIGGVRALRAMHIDPSVWHANEGHTSFMFLERLREHTAVGRTFEDAVRAVQARSLFTTHTPVPAGHDAFPLDLARHYLGPYCESAGLDLAKVLRLGENQEPWGTSFNMTVFGLRLSSARNAVSAKHGEVSRRMWRNLWPNTPEESVPVTHITNGVHSRTWIAEEMYELFNRYMGDGWWKDTDNPAAWERVDEIPDDELWDAHVEMRYKLMDFMREQAKQTWLESGALTSQAVVGGPLLDRDALTIVFAKRFATYKRAYLIFKDPARLARIITDPARPIQLVFSGKAHPRDHPGKEMIQYIYNMARDPRMQGNIAFLEDYGMHSAKYLVQGADLWLNNPVPPQEASGTSGQKAAINGVPQLSTLDGWWLEGFNGSNGWAISPHGPGAFGGDVDAQDANTIYQLLEGKIAPLFYDRGADGVPHGWVRVMKAAIRTSGPLFSARRMLKEYAARFYVPMATDGSFTPTN